MTDGMLLPGRESASGRSGQRLVTLATVGDLTSLYRLPAQTVKAWRARKVISPDVTVAGTDIYVLDRIAPGIKEQLEHEIDPAMLAEHQTRACVPSGSVLLSLQDIGYVLGVAHNTVKGWSSTSPSKGPMVLPEPAALLGPPGSRRPLPIRTASQFRDWTGYSVPRVKELAVKQTVRAPRRAGE